MKRLICMMVLSVLIPALGISSNQTKAAESGEPDSVEERGVPMPTVTGQALPSFPIQPKTGKPCRQNTKCKDKGPQGDCDGDGDKNETDPCPFDPQCKSSGGSFVGCIIITCQSFTSTFGRELNTTVDQVFNEVRQSGQAGRVLPIGQSMAGQFNMGMVLPAVLH